ncbi:hypothetical protein HA466_0149830 [Hirschfeldia incana]|nr:hypothetical protein HA466_0149830 [Hirschfeldia incana]
MACFFDLFCFKLGNFDFLVYMLCVVSREKYITGTVSALQSSQVVVMNGLCLRKLELQDEIAALCTLPGVGLKVAACVALFSLDQHSVIPVDTHVWQVKMS